MALYCAVPSYHGNTASRVKHVALYHQRTFNANSVALLREVKKRHE